MPRFHPTTEMPIVGTGCRVLHTRSARPDPDPPFLPAVSKQSAQNEPDREKESWTGNCRIVDAAMSVLLDNRLPPHKLQAFGRMCPPRYLHAHSRPARKSPRLRQRRDASGTRRGRLQHGLSTTSRRRLLPMTRCCCVARGRGQSVTPVRGPKGTSTMPCCRLLNNERVKAGGVGQTTRGFTAEEHGQASK